MCWSSGTSRSCRSCITAPSLRRRWIELGRSERRVIRPMRQSSTAFADNPLVSPAGEPAAAPAGLARSPAGETICTHYSMNETDLLDYLDAAQEAARRGAAVLEDWRTRFSVRE